MKRFKKHFLAFLSLLVILSNFSFATHVMICSMIDNPDGCQCSHSGDSPAQGLIVTKEDGGCCSFEVSELKNRNNLSFVKSYEPENVNSFGYTILNLSSSPVLQSNNSFSYFNSNIPKPESDIPILVSSLLI